MNTVDTDTRKSQEERKEEQKLRMEAQRLLALKDERLKENDQTPCPSCNVLVPLQANTCPTCGSDIAASNALLRESLRRLAEIEVELDARHRDQEERATSRRSIGNRLKRLFSGGGAEPEGETQGPRIRSRVETLKPTGLSPAATRTFSMNSAVSASGSPQSM